MREWERVRIGWSQQWISSRGLRLPFVLLLLLLAFPLIVGCCGSPHTVTFTLNNSLARPVAGEYAVLYRPGHEDTIFMEERQDIPADSGVTLFTSRQPLFIGYEYRITAVNENGQAICQWSFIHKKTSRHMMLFVPECESQRLSEAPADVGTLLPCEGCVW